MSANATGAPTTNFSIPKFNTASDAPNGKGVNEMMDAIDTLVADTTKVASNKITALADHDVPVWNGATWVRSATRQINNGGQVLPVITTSTFAGGPPGSPADGDIWIATGMGSNGERWTFQYNAGSASPYKWECIGGSPVNTVLGNANVVINTATQVGASGYYYSSGMNFTATRAGIWRQDPSVQFFPNGGVAGDCALSPFQGAALTAGVGGNGYMPAGSAQGVTIYYPFLHTVTTANTVIGMAGASPNNALYKFGQLVSFFIPYRIA